MRLSALCLVLCLALACTAVSASENDLTQAVAGEGYEWAALIEEEQQMSISQAFDEFVSEHGRVYATEEARAHAFAAFEANVHQANLLAELDAEATPKKTTTSTKPASKAATTSSKGTTRRRRVYKPNSKLPRARGAGKRVRVAAKKRTRRTRAQAKALAAQSKAGKLGQAAAAKAVAAAKAKAATATKKPVAGSGRAGGQSGGTGAKSGKSGGASGGTGSKSGKTGGESGGRGRKSGKTGGVSGGSGEKSGKTGGDAGKAGKKSGKTGGVDGKAAKKSGKTGGTDKSLQPVLPPKLKTSAPAANSQSTKLPQTDKKYDWLAQGQAETNTNEIARWNRALDFSAQLSKGALQNAAGMTGNGKVGALTPDSIREGMLTEGMSVEEADAAMTRAKYMKLIKSVQVMTDPTREDFGVQTQAGSCGSCWAYSAIDAIQRIQRDGTSPLYRQALSAQQVLDCVKTADSNGCKGGSPMDAFDWFASNPIALASEYPPTGTTGKCRRDFANRPRGYATGGWEMVIPSCKDSTGPCSGQIPLEAQLLEYWSTSTEDIPIVMYVDASNWNDYTGGVFDVSKCKSTTAAGNHLVSIIGFSTDPKTGIPFWIIQNSWGADWGANGRIFLPAYVNACGLANFVVTVLPPKVSPIIRTIVKDSRNESEASIKARLAASLQKSRATAAAAQAQAAAQKAAAPSASPQQQATFNDPLLAAILAGKVPSSGSYDLTTNTMGKL